MRLDFTFEELKLLKEGIDKVIYDRRIEISSLDCLDDNWQLDINKKMEDLKKINKVCARLIGILDVLRLEGNIKYYEGKLNDAKKLNNKEDINFFKEEVRQLKDYYKKFKIGE